MFLGISFIGPINTIQIHQYIIPVGGRHLALPGTCWPTQLVWSYLLASDDTKKNAGLHMV